MFILGFQWFTHSSGVVSWSSVVTLWWAAFLSQILWSSVNGPPGLTGGLGFQPELAVGQN